MPAALFETPEDACNAGHHRPPGEPIAVETTSPSGRTCIMLEYRCPDCGTVLSRM